MTVEKISAITLRVANMRRSVRFYKDVLGLEIIYGGEDADFSSLSTKDGTDPILNLEQGKPVLQWEHLIFRVSDVDLFWAYLTERGLRPESSRDASWGELFPPVGSRWPRIVISRIRSSHNANVWD